MWDVRWFWKKWRLDYVRVWADDPEIGEYLAISVLYFGPLCVAYHFLPWGGDE